MLDVLDVDEEVGDVDDGVVDDEILDGGELDGDSEDNDVEEMGIAEDEEGTEKIEDRPPIGCVTELTIPSGFKDDVDWGNVPSMIEDTPDVLMSMAMN